MRKNIYQKIAVILVFGFIVQSFLVGLFYWKFMVNYIIADINMQEQDRHKIMGETSYSIQKILSSSKQTDINDKIQAELDKYSKKYNVSFNIKNMNGDIIYSSGDFRENDKALIENGPIKKGNKETYILAAYFPTTMNYLDENFKQQRFRIALVSLILLITMFTLYLIYRILTKPLKKLSVAVERINYGNTEVEIPYYGKDEFGLLCRSFEDMGKRLKISEKNQQELIQAVSHDLKTPLTSILGYSKRLKEGKVEEKKIKEYYDTIFRKAKDLQSTIEELEEYININAEDKYNLVSTNCNMFFNDICSELQKEITNSGGSMSYTTRVSDDVYINADTYKLKRVFTNIVDNSLKYAGENCFINISVCKENEKILFEISDNGIGVSNEQLSRIFDRFYRVETSRCREKGGTGLGLSICKDIIEKHGGQIGARNSSEGGLCIWFDIYIKH